ncbi:hypothetical protein C8R46DRAFT_1212892 [Mycena filopes]|nr:hypothetical protein C8R46DRAFT_1212892 [Mycena filopes]
MSDDPYNSSKMYILRRAASIGLLFIHSSIGLTFGMVEGQMAIGRPAAVTWTSDSIDPVVWELAITNRTGDIVASVSTSVQGSTGQLSFVFPELEWSSGPGIFALQALSRDEVLATSEPFSVEGTFNDATTAPTIPSLPAAVGVLASVPEMDFATQDGSSSTLASPAASAIAQNDSSSIIRRPDVTLLVVGPILAVVTLGVIGFVVYTMCGCRRRPDETKYKVGEP